MLFLLVLLNLILYSHSDEVTISVDGVNLQTVWKKTLIYDGFATYYYHENELVLVKCLWSNIGEMKIELRDEKKLNWVQETNKIQFMIKLRTETIPQYVDCYHIDVKKTIVRIIFKPTPKIEYHDPWMIKINEMEWNPRPDKIAYKYVLGEDLYVSCLKTNYSLETAADVYSQSKLNTTELSHTLNCPDAGNNATQLLFYLMDTERISGLHSSNILFWFSDLKSILIIHYEYMDNDRLDLSWSVKPLEKQQNNYSVYIKDKQLKEVLDLKATGKYINLNIPIKLRADDHGITIRFWRSTKDTLKLYPHEYIWIKPLLKPFLPSDQSQKYQRHAESKLGFYNAVGSGVISLLLILMLVLYLINKRKQNVPTEESPEHCYENLTNETIPPFPSQWDTYANAQVDSNKDEQDLYSKPVPKSLRTGKIPKDENVGDSATSLYNQVETRVNSYREDSAGYASVR